MTLIWKLMAIFIFLILQTCSIKNSDCFEYEFFCKCYSSYYGLDSSLDSVI